MFAEKNCAECGGVYTPRTKVHKYCSDACRGAAKYTDGTVTTQRQYVQISGNWERYLSRLLYFNGRKRDLLTRDILMAQLLKQDYRCALTGTRLTCQLEKGKTFPTNASVDRVVAGGPYTADNIQLVCRAVNMWRSDLPVSDFVEWCRSVVAHNDKQRK
jgi:hypothetical protein